MCDLLWLVGVGNFTEIPTCEKQKIKKAHAKEKQSHTQDSIYVVRQFAYVHEVAKILLLSGKKKIQDVATIILHHKNTATKPTIKTLIKVGFYYTKWAKIFFSQGQKACP